MTVGERIKKRRIELGLTQSELAERMGYSSRAAICTVEKNKEDLTTARIRKYADALETTPAYLMGWTASPDIQVDNSQSTKALDNNIVERATKLYDLYLQAPPEIQAAVETLLKATGYHS